MSRLLQCSKLFTYVGGASSDAAAVWPASGGTVCTGAASRQTPSTPAEFDVAGGRSCAEHACASR